MSLVLTEEQEMLRDAARNFLGQHAPVAQLRSLRDDRDETGFDRSTWSRASDMGWAGVLLPEEFGGVDMGHVAAGVIAEEMGRNLTASPFLSSSVLGVRALLQGGTEAQKASWLQRLAIGDAIVALAVDERRKHNPAATACRADRAGNGFRLSGSKAFVLDGHVADGLFVLARTAGEPGAQDGLTLFLVDPSAKGVARERTIMVDSRNAARVHFDNVELTSDDVVGEVGEGWTLVEQVLDSGRAIVAAEMLGAASSAFDRTVSYLAEREQFGQKIGSFQALQHRAAELYVELEIARSAVLRALQILDEAPEKASPIVSLAKARMGTVALRVAQEGVQMHGGIGMTDEYDIGLYLKRVKAACETFGDDGFHLDRLARQRGF